MSKDLIFWTNSIIFRIYYKFLIRFVDLINFDIKNAVEASYATVVPDNTDEDLFPLPPSAGLENTARLPQYSARLNQ